MDEMFKDILFMESNFIKRLTDFYNSHTKCYCQALKGKKNKELYEEVMKNKPINLESNKLNEIIYWEIHNMKDYDSCPICGNPKKNFQRMITGYGQTCSKECLQKDMRRILKGVNSRTEESKKRRAEKIHNIWINKTNEEKLKISEKIKITKKLKYGNVNWNNNEKQIKTCFEKYGYKSACQVPEIKERQKVTKMTKYYNTILNNNKHIQPLFSLEEFLKLTINNQHLKYIYLGGNVMIVGKNLN